MPNTIKFSDNPNEETAFVTTEDDTRTRVVLTTPVDGTVKFPDNPNSTKVSVTVDGVARKAVAVYNLGGGGGDEHNLGWYATESALTTAHPTASNGDWAIVGATDTVWVWDSDTTAWKDTGQAGIELPDQTGHSGEFLTTDGTDASWAAVNALQNTATGTDALTIMGTPTSTTRAINIGNNSSATSNAFNAVAIGASATVNNNSAVAIGASSVASGDGSVAINGQANMPGSYARAVAIGGKVSGNKSIVIMTGNTNSYTNITASYATVLGYIADPNTIESNSFYVGVGISANQTVKLLSSDGTIPTARLTKVNTTITLAAADWSSNTQTVSVTGMTADGIVMVSPDPTDQSAYTSAGIICSAQAADSLTFTCSTTPSADLSVNVVML